MSTVSLQEEITLVFASTGLPLSLSGAKLFEWQDNSRDSPTYYYTAGFRLALGNGSPFDPVSSLGLQVSLGPAKRENPLSPSAKAQSQLQVSLLALSTVKTISRDHAEQQNMLHSQNETANLLFKQKVFPCCVSLSNEEQFTI